MKYEMWVLGHFPGKESGIPQVFVDPSRAQGNVNSFVQVVCHFNFVDFVLV